MVLQEGTLWKCTHKTEPHVTMYRIFNAVNPHNSNLIMIFCIPNVIVAGGGSNE